MCVCTWKGVCVGECASAGCKYCRNDMTMLIPISAVAQKPWPLAHNLSNYVSWHVDCLSWLVSQKECMPFVVVLPASTLLSIITGNKKMQTKKKSKIPTSSFNCTTVIALLYLDFTRLFLPRFFPLSLAWSVAIKTHLFSAATPARQPACQPASQPTIYHIIGQAIKFIFTPVNTPTYSCIHTSTQPYLFS